MGVHIFTGQWATKIMLFENRGLTSATIKVEANKILFIALNDFIA
jgi:hypothetical protein